MGTMPGDEEFTVESLDGGPPRQLGGSSWRRIRPPRWLTRRGVALGIVAFGVAAVLLATLAGLPARLWIRAQLAWLAPTTPRLSQVTLPTRPAAPLASGAWQSTRLPLPADHYQSFAADPADARVAYACGGPVFQPDGTTRAGTISFWRTGDGGTHWVRLPLPPLTGSDCGVRVAAHPPNRVALFVDGGSITCAGDHLVLSDDAGATWRQVPSLPSTPAGISSCYVTVWIAARHLFAGQFLEWSAPSAGGGVARTVAHLLRSDDDGATWRPLDGLLPGNGQEVWPTVLPDGQTLALSLLYPAPTPGEAPPLPAPSRYGSRLWISRDAGERWRFLGQLDGFSAANLLSNTGVPSLRQPLYLFTSTQIPWFYFRLRIAEVAGAQWALVPPLPIGGVSASTTGITQLLGETPAGKLLALGLGPHDAVGNPDAQTLARWQRAQWLWEWDPIAARWSVAAAPVPVPWPDHCSAACWSSATAGGQGPGDGGTTLWLSPFTLQQPGTLLRIRLPGG